MLFDIPYIADWKKIGDYRQHQTDLNNKRENIKCVDFDYKVGDKILIVKDGILCKAESPKKKRTMDYNNYSYEWNNQGYTRNQIRKS
jgi:hypothetical protein